MCDAMHKIELELGCVYVCVCACVCACVCVCVYTCVCVCTCRLLLNLLTVGSSGSGVLNPGDRLKWEGLLSRELSSSPSLSSFSGEGGGEGLYINCGGRERARSLLLGDDFSSGDGDSDTSSTSSPVLVTVILT